MFGFVDPNINLDADISEGDVIKTDAPDASRTRNVAELSARIKQAGGALTVGPNDSNYIVAVNNSLRFTVTRLANGQFRISESNLLIPLIAVAIIGGVVLLSKR